MKRYRVIVASGWVILVLGAGLMVVSTVKSLRDWVSVAGFAAICAGALTVWLALEFRDWLRGGPLSNREK